MKKCKTKSIKSQILKIKLIKTIILNRIRLIEDNFLKLLTIKLTNNNPNKIFEHPIHKLKILLI